jgi:hypothetical protein
VCGGAPSDLQVDVIDCVTFKFGVKKVWGGEILALFVSTGNNSASAISSRNARESVVNRST